MECTRQGSPLDANPSDLDTKGRLINIWGIVINIIINGALVQENECGLQSTLSAEVAWL